MREQEGKTSVLIADQGSHTRLVLANILDEDAGIEVAGTVADSDALLKAVKKLKPDVVLLNYSLPGNKNLFALQHLVSEASVAVILLLKQEQVSSELLYRAATLGVHTFICKPEPGNHPDYRSIATELLQKVKATSSAHGKDLQQRLTAILSETEKLLSGNNISKTTPESVVVIGASTGGTQALDLIIKELSDNVKACVLIALHMPAGFSKSLAERLQRSTGLLVKEGRAGLLLRPGKIIIAPGGRNMVVQPVVGKKAAYKIAFAEEKTAGLETPSVDLLMQSVATTTIATKIGVILTGMGKDGTKGAAALQKNGGTIIIQDEASSAIYGMARSVIGSGIPHQVLPLPEIPQYLNSKAENEITADIPGDSL